MKKFVIILWLLFLLSVISGCSFNGKILEKIFTGGNTNSSGQQQVEEKELAAGSEKESREVSIAVADNIEGQNNLTTYGPADYTSLVSTIEKSTINKYISSVLNNEKNKTEDNPYLIGDNTENDKIKQKVGELNKKIMEVNPVRWHISSINLVKKGLVMVSLEYRLPNGRIFTANKFFVKKEGGEWFIDFGSFNRSFIKVAQYARSGKGETASNR
ncbi:MAG: hypothetical protein K9L17_01315 [Clostridiales bacterium]|nr:hypothetical protein [Clostridiales bacterium]MCF8021330.1 hypothetical protein [Clostridiales bacterium]